MKNNIEIKKTIHSAIEQVQARNQVMAKKSISEN